MSEWQPIETAPHDVWLRTRRDGENGENVCRLLHGDEWAESGPYGRTTVTHHSFAAPTHWMPLPGVSE